MNPVLFELPPLALDAARRELLLLGNRVGDLLDAAVPMILGRSPVGIDKLDEREQRIDRHHASLVAFIEKLMESGQSPDICRTAIDLVEAADYLESIGDLIDREMIPLYQRHAECGVELSMQARERLRSLAEAVSQELRRALHAVAEADQSLAQDVLETKAQVRSLERTAIEPQFVSQQTDNQQWVLPTAMERELAESLRRAYSLVRRFVRIGTGLH